MPNKKTIVKEAKSLLKTGLSRQETYEKLTSTYKNRKLIADVLRNMPSQKAKDQYLMWNFILLGVLISIAAIYLYAYPSLGLSIWLGFSIFVVASMRTNYYIWISILAGISLFSGTVTLIMSHSNLTNWNLIVVLLCLNTLALTLPIWLRKKLCPSPIEKKEKYQNVHGQNKIRLTYEFTE